MSMRSRKRIALVTDGLIDVYQVYQRELRKAFEQVAHKAGFSLAVVIGKGLGHVDRSERAQNAVYDWVRPQSFDGAVLLSGAIQSSPGNESLESLVARLGDIPKVSIGVPLRGVASVTIDNRAGMRDAVDHLVRVHGCQKVAYLAGPSENREAAARLEGYRHALRSNFMPSSAKLIVASPFTIEGGTQAMQKLLDQGLEFDAVVAANDAIAIGALKVLEARSLGVPDSVRLIAFDDSPLASASGLSSVAQPFHQLAHHALGALKDVMDGRQPRPVEFFPRLALRESCGCTGAVADTDLPVLDAWHSAAGELSSQRTVLAGSLAQANASSFNWWITRVDRLIDGVEAALAGEPTRLMSTLDELTLEAIEDDVPVVQIAHNLACLERYFAAQARGGRSGAEASLWDDALSRLNATHASETARLERERSQRTSSLDEAIREVAASRDAPELGRRLASSLARLDVSQAYLGVMSTDGERRFWPLLQLDESGVAIGSPDQEGFQLLPPCPGDSSPSTCLVAAVTQGSEVCGVWACDGAVDLAVFEQLRVELGDALGRLTPRGVSQRATLAVSASTPSSPPSGQPSGGYAEP